MLKTQRNKKQNSIESCNKRNSAFSQRKGKYLSFSWWENNSFFFLGGSICDSHELVKFYGIYFKT